MSLSNTILAAATFGTESHPIEIVPFDRTNTHSTPEAQLLLEVAQTYLRAQATTTPPRDHRPLCIPLKPHAPLLTGARSRAQLRMMLTGIHAYALKEWLLSASQHAIEVSSELLPSLLLLGLNQRALRPYIYPVVKESGPWLAREIRNQNWKWVLSVPERSVAEAVEIERQQEKVLMAELQKGGFQRLFRNRHLWNAYQPSWSPALTFAFVTAIETYQGPWWLGGFTNVFVRVAYFFPLDMWSTVLHAIASSPVFGPNAIEIAAGLNVIRTFRQNMLHTLAEDVSLRGNERL